MPKHFKKLPTPSESEEVPSSLESESDDQHKLAANNAFGNDESDLYGEEGEDDFEEGEEDFD